jgi:hypothetical protein
MAFGFPCSKFPVFIARVDALAVRELLRFCSLMLLALIAMSRSIGTLSLMPSVAVHFTSFACSSAR